MRKGVVSISEKLRKGAHIPPMERKASLCLSEGLQQQHLPSELSSLLVTWANNRQKSFKSTVKAVVGRFVIVPVTQRELHKR